MEEWIMRERALRGERGFGHGRGSHLGKLAYVSGGGMGSRNSSTGVIRDRSQEGEGSVLGVMLNTTEAGAANSVATI